MAVILGGTTLNPNMIWVERYSYSPVVQDVQMTLGGNPVIYSQELQAAAPITLVALQDQGWLTKDMADAVQAFANQAGAQFNLTIGALNFTVMFRHQDAPALNLHPLLPRAVPLTGDYFIGEIKLMTV